MSASNDSGCSLHLVDCHGRKEGIVFSVRKGVSSFDYSKELNVIGMSLRILRWQIAQDEISNNLFSFP